MSEITYRIVEAPHDYFPDRPDRVVMRMQAHSDETPVGYIDYFVEDGWTFFFSIYSGPEYRGNGLAEKMTLDIATIYMTTKRGFVYANPLYEPIYEKLIATANDKTWAWEQMMRVDWAEDDPLRPAP